MKRLRRLPYNPLRLVERWVDIVIYNWYSLSYDHRFEIRVLLIKVLLIAMYIVF